MSFLPAYCENIPAPFTHVKKEFHWKLPVKVDNVENQPQEFWSALSSNPSAIFLLEKYPEKINWSCLSSNSSAIHLLEKHPEKIDYDQLSYNTNAAHLIRRRVDKINWKALSANPGAISILKEYPQCIYWRKLSVNPAAFDILCDNLDKVDWNLLTMNPCAVPILRANLDKVQWGNLIYNHSKEAMDLLEEYQEEHNDEINFDDGASSNPYAIRFFLENRERLDTMEMQSNPAAIEYFPEVFNEAPHEISFESATDNPRLGDLLQYYPFDWETYTDDENDSLGYIADHPNIFEIVEVEYDYDGILDAFYELNEEFHAWAGHPSRTHKWKDWQLDGWELFEEDRAD